MGTTITPHATDEFWRIEENVDTYLARKLCSGSTSLVLGAGASHGFNLPNWKDLVAGVRNQCGEPAPITDIRVEDEADQLRRKHFKSDRLGFAKAVRIALYEKASHDPKFLLKSDLLQALSAFLTNSLRGKGGTVVTFNFDDILESYLRLLGFVVRSETVAPAWATDADMLVYHPHGLLPKDSESGSTPIVFSTSDFDEVVGKDSEPWNQTMREVWSTTFPVFIGLSGDDARLRSLLKTVKPSHPAINNDGSIYWGVRPTPVGTDEHIIERWREAGIAPRFISGYEELPVWILSICQKAAEIHDSRR